MTNDDPTKRRRVFSSSDFGFRASGFGGLRVTNLDQDLTARSSELEHFAPV